MFHRCIFFLFFVSTITKAQTGLIWNDEEYQQMSPAIVFTKSQPPAQVSYEKYCPDVLHQGEFNTCVGFACSYYLQTIIEAKIQRKSDKKSINQLAFSPLYLYQKSVSNLFNCKSGTTLKSALNQLKSSGVPSFKEYPYLNCDKNFNSRFSQFSKINDFRPLFNINDAAEKKIFALKQALKNFPAVIGISTSEDFYLGDGKIWNPFNIKPSSIGHAICVVGYDDDFITPRGKGAFRLINSFGKTWRDNGFCWLPYQAIGEVARYGYEVYPAEIMPKMNEYEESAVNTLDFNEITLQLLNEEILKLNILEQKNEIPVFQSLKPLTSGNTFKVYLKNSQEAYFYVFSTDLTQNIYRLFPKSIDEKMEISSIPTAIMSNNSITLDNTKGMDYFMFIMSDEPLNADLIEEKLKETKLSNPAERLSKALNIPEIPQQSIQLMDDKLKFILSEGYKVLPFIIQIEHR